MRHPKQHITRFTNITHDYQNKHVALSPVGATAARVVGRDLVQPLRLQRGRGEQEGAPRVQQLGVEQRGRRRARGAQRAGGVQRRRHARARHVAPRAAPPRAVREQTA